MNDEKAVLELLADLESARVERTISTTDTDKFCQAICAFANDMAGPLYGLATPANFPKQTSYRNPVIAEAMKTLGFVNRFGRGVERAQAALNANGSPIAEFDFGDTFFGVTVRVRARP